jgi:hypothetical protein
MTCDGYTAYVHYRVQIDAIGAIDTFKWSDDGGTTWQATGVQITGVYQDLNNGVKIKFDQTTYHTNADYWDFYAGDGIFLGERLIYYFKNYGGSDLVYHSFHKGTTTQGVDSQLQFEVPEWNETMRNTAYSYFRLTYDVNAWQQLGDYTVVLKGKKLYDPRIDDTQFSRNPALVWLDFLTNKRYGLGVPLTAIDLDSVMDVANWCDANDYYFDGIILDRTYFGDHLEQILMNFRAFTIWSEGKYYLKVFTDDAAVMALDENDVEISPDSFQINIPGIDESPNLVKTTFSDSLMNFTANFATEQDLSAISFTGDPTPFEMTLIGTANIAQAQALSKYTLMRFKYNTTYSLLVHPRCYVLEPGDMVTVTHEFPAWTAKKLRVKDLILNQDGKVNMTFMDEDSSIYI